MRLRNLARQARFPVVSSANRAYVWSVRNRVVQERPSSRRRTTLGVAQCRHAASETSAGPVQAALHGLFCVFRPINGHLPLGRTLAHSPTLLSEMNGPNLIAVNVGNSRAQIGRFIDGELNSSAHVENNRLPSAVQLVVQWWEEIAHLPHPAILLASANDPVANRLAAMLADQLSVEMFRVGEDVPVPIGRQLDPETITGVDRLLNAAAAYDRIQQACVVIDAGTAVTVDFVDGDGTFHGGAIAPGAAIQLRALHENTASLPDLRFTAPDDEAFGRSTAQAMLKGVYHGIRGMVQRLIERYAESYGAYPQVIATGGDAKVLFETEDLVDQIVPDLTLLGIAAAASHALAGKEVDGTDARS